MGLKRKLQEAVEMMSTLLSTNQHHPQLKMALKNVNIGQPRHSPSPLPAH